MICSIRPLTHRDCDALIDPCSVMYGNSRARATIDRVHAGTECGVVAFDSTATLVGFNLYYPPGRMDHTKVDELMGGLKGQSEVARFFNDGQLTCSCTFSHWLWVSSSHRGQGIGRQMKDLKFNTLAQSGVETLLTTVRDHPFFGFNPLSWFQRLGYQGYGVAYEKLFGGTLVPYHLLSYDLPRHNR